MLQQQQQKLPRLCTHCQAGQQHDNSVQVQQRGQQQQRCKEDVGDQIVYKYVFLEVR
jgi:hypothetical protein